MKKTIRLIRDIRGSSLLEFAIVLPLFLLLLCAVIEFGWYFIRYEAVSRAVSITAATIANDSNTLMQADAEANAGGAVPFGNGSSYICAQAYSTNAKALAASPNFCNAATAWPWTVAGNPPTCTDTGNPCVGAYYVGIVAYGQSFSLTGFASAILPKVTAITQHVIQPVGVETGGTSTLGIQFITPVLVVGDGPIACSSNSVNKAAATTVALAGVPSTATALIVSGWGFANQNNKGGSSPTVSIQNSAGTTYLLLGQDSGSTNLISSNEGIYPVVISGGEANIIYSATAGWNCFSIEVFGYIN